MRLRTLVLLTVVGFGVGSASDAFAQRRGNGGGGRSGGGGQRSYQPAARSGGHGGGSGHYARPRT